MVSIVFAAQWMVEIVEADPERRKMVEDATTATARHLLDDAYQKIDALVEALRRDFHSNK